VADRPELSVVIPAYDEEANIAPMVERLEAALDGVVDGLEIVFVDDGSTDGTWDRISGIARRNPVVRGVRFSRNFGHQAALTAGVAAARGEAVVIIDADLQDPPEVVPEMVDRWREGYEVVFAQRERREGETWFKKATARWFYRLLRAVTNVDIPVDTGDFRLMGPRAVAAFRALPERNRFIRGLVAWLGFPQAAVRYRRHARAAGETKYPLRKMLRLAGDGFVGFSYLPLRLATYAGLAVVAAALAGAAVIIVMWAVRGVFFPPGLVAAALVLLGGVQLVGIGLLGEYVGRTLDEVRGRPLYIVQEETGGPDGRREPQPDRS